MPSTRKRTPSGPRYGAASVIVRKTDPSLIAGVLTRVGDMVFDGTVKNRLDELRQRMLEDPRPTEIPSKS